MKIVFDSDVVFDEKAQAVRFAGHFVDEKGQHRFLVCNVPQEGLVKRFRLHNPPPHILLKCYSMLREEINALAANKAKLGDFRPVIRPQELSQDAAVF